MDKTLPKYLEVALESLLQANTLRSSTVQENGKMTTVVLRFKMDAIVPD